MVDAATDQSDPANEPSATPADGVPSSGGATRNAATDVNKIVKRKIQQCRRIRREFVPEWSENVDYLRAKPFDTDSDFDRVAITADWSNTKRKKAQLFSQVPKLRLKTRRRWDKTLPSEARIVFQNKVNDTLEDINVGAVMDECLSNVINAAGVCAALVTYETRIEMRVAPQPTGAIPGFPVLPQAAAPVAAPVPPQAEEQGETNEPDEAGEPQAPPAPPTVPYTTDRRMNVSTVSPADFLWDVSFQGSDWNKCPMVGNSGRFHWGQALKEFGKSKERPNGLTEEDKQKVCGKDDRNTLDRITSHTALKDRDDTDIVSYDQIFYRRFYFDPSETSFEAIQRVVFVRGRGNVPVIDELWRGQKRVPTPNGEALIGSCKFPLQVGTLTYVTDEAIPPSDSAMARPQVDELMLGRGMMMAQRRFSLPWRWFNNNLVPPELVTQLMRGEYQGAVPLNGSGERVMGEIARAQYPREDFEFDRVAKAEMDAVWNLGTSMSGGGAGNTQVRSAAEAEAVQGNMSTVIAMDRAKTVKFFCGIAEVVAGFLSIYGDFTPEEEAALQAWDRQKFASYFLYTVRGDASVLLDAKQRLAQLERVWNLSAKSGMVDELPILQEILSLNDVDEAYAHAPVDKGPEPMNMSIRLDQEALNDPMVVAMLMATKQLPGPEALAAAKKAIIAAHQVDVELMPGAPVPGVGGAPVPAPVAGGGPAPNPHPPVQDVMPHLNEADRVNKRTHDGA